MAVAQATFTIGTTAAVVSPTTASTQFSMTIQNTHATNILYVGDANVTSSAYGIRMNPGDVISFDSIPASNLIYAVGSATGTTVSTMNIIR